MTSCDAVQPEDSVYLIVSSFLYKMFSYSKGDFSRKLSVFNDHGDEETLVNAA